MGTSTPPAVSTSSTWAAPQVARTGCWLAARSPATGCASLTNLATTLAVRSSPPAAVTSPTFVIASEYPTAAGRRLTHVDLYRVESPEGLEAAGFADLLEPGAVVAGEWADRFPAALPPDRLEIEIRRPDPVGNPAGRVLHALSSGPVSSAVLVRWREALAARGGRPDLDRD